jgi:ribosomal protein L21E
MFTVENYSAIRLKEPNKIFICGGRNGTVYTHSKKSYILDIETGFIEEKEKMIIGMLNHGITRAGDKIYCAYGCEEDMVLGR